MLTRPHATALCKSCFPPVCPLDFAPVFHIKLRDHVLLEGDPVTLSCLPAGSPHPHIAWVKGQGFFILPFSSLLSKDNRSRIITLMRDYYYYKSQLSISYPHDKSSQS